MELVTPGIGLVFWMLLSFSIVLFLLKKFAWKPIINMLKEREDSISDALNAAEKAKEKMAELNAENEKIIEQANKERKKILAEAYEENHNVITNAKAEAQKEADKIIDNARISIEHEKQVALSEIKHLMADLSIEIAEKILKRELNDSKDQAIYVESLLKDIKLN